MPLAGLPAVLRAHDSTRSNWIEVGGSSILLGLSQTIGKAQVRLSENALQPVWPRWS